MNFQDLLKVENADFYLDQAFKRAGERVEMARQKKANSRIEKSRFIESARIQAVSASLEKNLRRILKSFPSLDNLPIFYFELIKATIDFPTFKRSLGAVKWGLDKAKFFTAQYLGKISKCRELEKVNSYRREYYGRVSSVIKQIGKSLMFLEQARKTMKGFPTVKTSLFTVSIVGFPNVGKTTLLYKLTGSRPEINDYAFTTRSINVSYFRSGKTKVQLLDTPGTLNRVSRMNYIEKQAYLAVKHCTHFIVYVFDLTLSYPIEDQVALYKKICELEHPISVYFSKADLVPRKEIMSFSKPYKLAFHNPDKLKKLLSEKAENFQKI